MMLTQISAKEQEHMLFLIDVASKAAALGEVPVAASLVTSSGQVISVAHNLRETRQSALAHAEALVIEEACSHFGRWRLHDCTLFVTLEPCLMCAGAIVLARIPRVVFGAFDPKAGAVGSLWNMLQEPRLNHQCHVVSGVCAEESSRLLKTFFRERRCRS